jgi:hypothetical protein
MKHFLRIGVRKAVVASTIALAAVIGALVVVSTGASVNTNPFKTQHGHFANGKAIQHASGALEVT